MKFGIETFYMIQYMLSMVSIAISGASYVYRDNMSVIHNISKSELLKTKCNTIAYHAICKSVTMGEMLTGHIRSENNPAYLLTKIVTGNERKHLVSFVLYDIMMRKSNNGQVFFFCHSKTVSYLNNVMCMNVILRGLQGYGWKNIVWIQGK